VHLVIFSKHHICDMFVKDLETMEITARSTHFLAISTHFAGR